MRRELVFMWFTLFTKMISPLIETASTCCQTKTKVNIQRARKNHDWLGFTSNRQHIGAWFFFFWLSTKSQRAATKKSKTNVTSAAVKAFFLCANKTNTSITQPKSRFHSTREGIIQLKARKSDKLTFNVKKEFLCNGSHNTRCNTLVSARVGWCHVIN